MKNIVLIGMRGSGKTQIAKVLAQKLKKKFVDLDLELTKKAKQSIPEIVEQHGWEHFRKLEAEIVKDFSPHSNLIIATGGGVVLDAKNIINLRKNGTIVLLQARPEILAQRILHSTERPSLTGKTITEELEVVWQERQEQYLSSADIIINVELTTNNPHLDVEKKVQQILEQLK